MKCLYWADKNICFVPWGIGEVFCTPYSVLSHNNKKKSAIKVFPAETFHQRKGNELWEISFSFLSFSLPASPFGHLQCLFWEFKSKSGAKPGWGGGRAGTNYRGLAIWKGSRGVTMLHMVGFFKTLFTFYTFFKNKCFLFLFHVSFVYQAWHIWFFVSFFSLHIITNPVWRFLASPALQGVRAPFFSLGPKPTLGGPVCCWKVHDFITPPLTVLGCEGGGSFSS